MKPQITEIIARLARFPALSPSVQQLLPMLGRDDVDIAQLLEAICHDPGLVARLLRLANSPFFGMPRQVASIREAALILGARHLRGLVVGTVMQDLLSPVDPEAWPQGLAVAAVASDLASEAGLDRQAAFTAGLLHNLGAILMQQFHPQAWQALASLDAAGPERLAGEGREFGFDRCELTAAIARHWNFPEATQHALGYFLAPPEASTPPLTALLHRAYRQVAGPTLAAEAI